MVQAIMENQSAKLNKKKVSTKFVAAIGGLTGGLFLMLMGLTLSAISYFKQTSVESSIWDVNDSIGASPPEMSGLTNGVRRLRAFGVSRRQSRRGRRDFGQPFFRRSNVGSEWAPGEPVRQRSCESGWA